MKDWEQAELHLVNLLNDCFGFGGKVVTDLSLQYDDIDVIDHRGNTYSVKLQNYSNKSGNFAFEHTLEDTSTGDTTQGSFSKCKADYYTIFKTLEGKTWCFLFDTKAMREHLNNNSYRSVHTNTTTELNNTNRKYNRGHCTLVPVKDIYYLPWVTVFHCNDTRWLLHLKQRIT